MKKPDSYFMDNWRAADGSGDDLIHDLDLLRFVLGEVEDVTALARLARGAARVERRGGDALASGTAAINFADTTPSLGVRGRDEREPAYRRNVPGYVVDNRNKGRDFISVADPVGRCRRLGPAGHSARQSD